MNLFRLVAWFARSRGNSFLEDVALLRVRASPPFYSVFHDRGWLDQASLKP